MLTVITNNHERDLIFGSELSEKERKEFDYYTDEQLAECRFFRYKGEVYDPGEFQITDRMQGFEDWSLYQSDTFFSGILIKWAEDYEAVIVGRYYS